MSELREECYKCLSNQSCPGAAEYGSILCMTRRKYRMPENGEDRIYAHKFAIMQKQIDEKDAIIKKLEEENHLQRKQIMSAYDKGWIPVQKVKDKIERHKFAKKDFEKEYDSKNYKDDGLRARDFYMIVAEDLIIKALEEILEDK